jgi:hypothetical protein
MEDAAMSEDVPLYNGPTIVVTTDDGTLFSCTPYEIGGLAAPRQLRWKLIDARALEYIGPPYARGLSPADVQRLVSEWWEAKKALGQAGVTVEMLRDRIARGD